MSPCVVVVTGGCGGIGRAIAKAVTNSGQRCVVFDNRDDESTRSYCTAIKQVFSVDITRRAEIEQAVDEVEKRIGAVYGLVNCAGISPKAPGNRNCPTWELSQADWDQVFLVNVVGTLLCCQVVLPRLIARRRGSVVNIGSIMGETGVGSLQDDAYPISNSLSHYCASKAAVHNLTRSLGREAAAFGVRVNCVAPGAVDTGMLALDADVRHRLSNQIPLGALATPDDVAAAVQFLLDPVAARMVTSQVLFVNGGWR